LNQGKVSDGAFKTTHDFQSDIEAYTKFAAKLGKYGDKKCDPLPIWPEVILSYCDENADKNGFGDDELLYCTCYDVETTKLTIRKPKTKGLANVPKNYESLIFKGGVPPKIKVVVEEPGRAIMDLGATYLSKGAWDGSWKNPRLDSRTGFHNA
jgi:hypothetical protein